MMFPNFLLQATSVTDTVASTTATIATNAASTENVSYLSFLLKGGILIIPIIALMFFCIYVIIERYLSIKKATKFDPNLVNDIKMQLKAGKLDNAIMVCERDRTASANILKS